MYKVSLLLLVLKFCIQFVYTLYFLHNTLKFCCFFVSEKSLTLRLLNLCSCNIKTSRVWIKKISQGAIEERCWTIFREEVMVYLLTRHTCLFIRLLNFPSQWNRSEDKCSLRSLQVICCMRQKPLLARCDTLIHLNGHEKNDTVPQKLGGCLTFF